MSTRHIGTHHRRMVSYPRSLVQSVYTIFFFPLATVAVAAIFLRGFATVVPTEQLSLGAVLAALTFTFMRLLIAYLFSIAFAIPLALLVTESAWAERVFLPVFDIMQSVPVLAFFPVIIVFFVHYGLYSSAAVFILFLSMLWNIVFSLVGGLHSIPTDIKSVGALFGLHGFAYLKEILLPSVFPYLITGSLLAWAQGWNIVIVAEVLHVYIPGATASSDIVGIGSMLVHASAAGQTQAFLLAIAALVTAVALINFFVWQKLLKYAERFRFE
ncbi:MAG: ABC transporter permease subunit [Minisyncoccia bacterium]|jgi:NitT/TauT family transport system permease protein